MFLGESMTPADSWELAGAWGWVVGFAICYLLSALEDHGDGQHAQRAKDQGQPEVAHDLETQGGDRNTGEGMNV